MLMMRWFFRHLVALRRKEWGPDAHDALALLAFGGLEGGNRGVLMLMVRWLFWHLVGP